MSDETQDRMSDEEFKTLCDEVISYYGDAGGTIALRAEARRARRREAEQDERIAELTEIVKAFLHAEAVIVRHASPAMGVAAFKVASDRARLALAAPEGK